MRKFLLGGLAVIAAVVCMAWGVQSPKIIEQLPLSRMTRIRLTAGYTAFAVFDLVEHGPGPRDATYAVAARFRGGSVFGRPHLEPTA